MRIAGGLNFSVRFKTRKRVHRTSNFRALKNLADASVVIHTWANGLGRSRRELIRKIRVREQLSPHRDKVRPPLREQRLRLIGLDPTDRNDWNLDTFLNGLSERNEAPGNMRRVGFGIPNRPRGISIGTHVYSVGSRRLRQFRHAASVVEVLAIYEEFFAVNPTPKRIVVSDLTSRRFDDLDQKACAILDGTTVFVFAPIRGGRKEIIDQVAMTRVELAAVDAGSRGTRHRVGITLSHCLNIVGGHFVKDKLRARDARRRSHPARFAGGQHAHQSIGASLFRRKRRDHKRTTREQVFDRSLPVMYKLQSHLRTVLVRAIRELRPTLYKRVISNGTLMRTSKSFWSRNPGRADD